MQAIDQNTIIQSMEQALVAPPGLVDGRTEKDWLCFLTEFASLINFYDNNNVLKGNWTPFLAKDPVLLLATISKTPFSKFYTNYNYICTYLEKLNGNQSIPGEFIKELAYGFNQLFDELVKVFMCIKRWIYYMKLSVIEYPLKTYVLQQVKSVYSSYFWALLSLRQNLFLSGAISGINPVDQSQFFFFDAYDEMLWKQDKDKSPYWETLGLQEDSGDTQQDIFPLKKGNNNANIISPIFNAVVKMGNELFVFFNKIIAQSAVEFETMKTKNSKYPDTLLLRTFVNLLQIPQEQLNGITERHLRFYYKDILKQELLPAVADQVYICAELGKKDAAFTLPDGAQLDAGLDTQNNPVLFSVPGTVNLNPAQITGAYTLTLNKTPAGGPQQLSLAPINNTGTLLKDENGNIQTWDTFGGGSNPLATVVKPGIAFASPLLLLREGDRYITITLTVKSPVDLKIFQNAGYYLSTTTAWFEINKNDFTVESPAAIPGNDNSVLITIHLQPLAPAIEAFLLTPASKNPDGFITEWPALKIGFDKVADLSSPPELAQLTIAVKVIGLKTLPLYNDFGPLNTKTSYPLFGPAPLVNSNFIFGSDELFSKPLLKMFLQLDWDGLPGDFSTYYNEYNFYLTGKYSAGVKPGLIDKMVLWLKRAAQRLKKWVIRVLKIKTAANTSTSDNQPPFCNTAFKVGFENLDNKIWSPVEIKKAELFQDLQIQFNWDPYTTGKDAEKTICNCGVEREDDELFSIDSGSCNNMPSSCFVYDPLSPAPPVKPATLLISPDPQLQLTPLQFTGQSNSGFIKMNLTGPAHGFGSDIYANVVSKMAMYNAWLLVHQSDFCSEPPKFKNQAQLPYVPKLSAFTIHYEASEQYDFSQADTNSYPLQCFLYAPLITYKLYDSAAAVPVYNYTVTSPPAATKPGSVPPAIPLYQPFLYNGYLFLQLENVVPANEISLYFELARKYTASASLNSIDFYYLSAQGWKALPVVSDATKGFGCTGIIKVNMPGDIAQADLFGTTAQYWIAIAAKDNPSVYPQTAFLKTNGMLAVRSGQAYFPAATIPGIAPLTIQKFWKPVSQVSTIIQPFPSFGSKAPEGELSMNQRIANRIKTKDRIVNADDYKRMIRQEYKDICYSSTLFNQYTKNTTVYVAKAAAGVTAPNGFIPLVSECKISAIQTFLRERASAFSNITVSNFDLLYVQVNAKITVKKGCKVHDVQESISRSLDIFLSPWITSNQQQVAIGQAISIAQVVSFIRKMGGVAAVEQVTFTTRTIDYKNCKFKIIQRISGSRTILPLPGALFVSYRSHNIKCTADND